MPLLRGSLSVDAPVADRVCDSRDSRQRGEPPLGAPRTTGIAAGKAATTWHNAFNSTEAPPLELGGLDHWPGSGCSRLFEAVRSRARLLEALLLALAVRGCSRLFDRERPHWLFEAWGPGREASAERGQM